MTDIVVSIESIKIKAQREYMRGFRLCDCPLPEFSAAAQTWREEWKRMEWLDEKKRVLLKGCA